MMNPEEKEPAWKTSTFGGLMISPGPLVYRNNQFELQSSWNEVSSYSSVYGNTNGSTYFSFIELGQRFDSRGSSFSTSSGSINNGNPLSFSDYNDWRVPTIDEFKIILTTSSATRPGSTVNGKTNKHYAFIITNNILYAGANYARGTLVFPDNKIIVGKNLSYTDAETGKTTGVTSAELNTYLNQGCIFFQSGAGYTQSSNSWGNTADALTKIWSATEQTQRNGYIYWGHYSGSVNMGNGSSKSDSHQLTYLVRTAE